MSGHILLAVTSALGRHWQKHDKRGVHINMSTCYLFYDYYEKANWVDSVCCMVLVSVQRCIEEKHQTTYNNKSTFIWLPREILYLYRNMLRELINRKANVFKSAYSKNKIYYMEFLCYKLYKSYFISACYNLTWESPVLMVSWDQQCNWTSVNKDNQA